MLSEAQPRARKLPRRIGDIPVSSSTVAVAPNDEVTLELAITVLGLTRAAMETKIQRGQWLEDRQYRRAPDGSIWIIISGVRAWLWSQPDRKAG